MGTCCPDGRTVVPPAVANPCRALSDRPQVMMLEDKGTGARCAVKRIDLRQLSERKRAQALAEADHLRNLVHPCICGLYGSFVEAQVVHIGMELCAGGTVDSWLESRRGSLLPAEVVLDCFLQVRFSRFSVDRQKRARRARVTSPSVEPLVRPNAPPTALNPLPPPARRSPQACGMCIGTKCCTATSRRPTCSSPDARWPTVRLALPSSWATLASLGSSTARRSSRRRLWERLTTSPPRCVRGLANEQPGAEDVGEMLRHALRKSGQLSACGV